MWEDPLPDYIVRSATRLKFDPRTEDRTDDYDYICAKYFAERKQLNKHQRRLLYRERPDLDLDKERPLENPIDHEITTLSDFFDTFHPTEERKLFSCMYTTFAVSKGIMSNILSKGYSISVKDINCEIRYKDNSLELIKSIDGGLLIYTTTNSDEVIQQYVTIEGEKQEIKIYNTEKKAWEEAKVTKEFKRTDAKNIIEFS